MTQKLRDHESHARYCPTKNAKSAIFVVASFAVIAFASWRGLDKPPAHSSLDQLVIVMIVTATLPWWLAEFTCFRERFLLGLVFINLLKMEVQGFAPSVFSKHLELIKSAEFASALVGLFVSLTMLIDAARSPSPNAGPSGG
jgi:hypothetical protein